MGEDRPLLKSLHARAAERLSELIFVLVRENYACLLDAAHVPQLQVPSDTRKHAATNEGTGRAVLRTTGRHNTRCLIKWKQAYMDNEIVDVETPAGGRLPQQALVL
jgi:hypothetical protein